MSQIMSENLLGQRLIRGHGLSTDALARALDTQANHKDERLGAILVRLGALSEATLLQALSEQLDLDVLNEAHTEALLPSATATHQTLGITQAFAQRLAFFIGRDDNGAARVAARDPLQAPLLEYLDRLSPQLGPWRFTLISARDLERSLGKIYRVDISEQTQTDLRKLAEDAPVVELVNHLVARANDLAASDIHIEPEDGGFMIRYRVDGRLATSERYGRERFDAVVSRVKLIAGLDIAERRLPQDGRFSTRAAGIDVDVRVSVIPSALGESIVMRLLPNMQGLRFSLDNIGFEVDHLAIYRQWMAEPDGIILVTGPTGSGKSTTLYATLVGLDTSTERVLTVEDPVEYQIPGVTQFQVHAEIGFTFPAALRSILRHDPDTIMIGEIRDVETARIAVQSSLTGHRVFSTLHTNDAATAFLRLADMGVEPFLIGATVRGVIAQRLVRRLCNECAIDRDRTACPETTLKRLNALGWAQEELRLRAPRGCAACNQTGYRGRVAVYELLAATDALKAHLGRGDANQHQLLAAAQSGFRNLQDDALIKAARGITSLEEAFLLSGFTNLSPGES
jgi:general secretion pathway protein E